MLGYADTTHALPALVDVRGDPGCRGSGAGIIGPTGSPARPCSCDVGTIVDRCTTRAQELTLRGRLEAAIAVAEVARDAIGDDPGQDRSVRVRSLMATVHARAGHRLEADALLAGLRGYPDLPDAFWIATLARARMIDDAREARRAAIAIADRTPSAIRNDPDTAPIAVATLLDQKCGRVAGRLGRGLETPHGDWGAVAPHVVLRVRGLLSGDVTPIDEAIGLLRHAQRPLTLAAALEDRARFTPADARAQHPLREALAIFESHGAHGEARRLRADGRSGVVAVRLTPAQERVACLVAEGLTNREVADRLSLSPHTVDTQLRQIFARWGVSSRATLAARVARNPPGGPR